MQVNLIWSGNLSTRFGNLLSTKELMYECLSSLPEVPATISFAIAHQYFTMRLYLSLIARTMPSVNMCIRSWFWRQYRHANVCCYILQSRVCLANPTTKTIPVYIVLLPVTLLLDMLVYTCWYTTACMRSKCRVMVCIVCMMCVW